MLKAMVEALDAKAGKRVDKDIRRTQKQNVGSSQVDVAELYSLPRMATMAAKL